MRKVGGLYFWKIGRLGGSVYITKPKPKPARKPMTWDDANNRFINAGLLFIAAFAGVMILVV